MFLKFTLLRNLEDLHAWANKCGLCKYDDKRYLLANLPDGSQNFNTHAYGHRKLATMERLVSEKQEQSRTKLVIKQQHPPPQTNPEQKPDYTTYHVVKHELQ